MPGVRIWPNAADAHCHSDRTTAVRMVSNRCWLTIPRWLEASADQLVANLHHEQGAT